MPIGIIRSALAVPVYLGIDVGSVTTKFSILDEKRTLIARLYARTDERPIDAVQVAANTSIVRAFERELGIPVLVPPNYDVMGAIGAAMLAREWATRNGDQTRFKGFESNRLTYSTMAFECKGCSNHCEIVGIKVDDETVARWGRRCGKWAVV